MCIKSISLAAIFLVLSTSVNAIPVSLEGMEIIKQWTDFENQTGEMPANIWGSSDATNEDRIGLHVVFDNGLEGSITYSGVSGLWNTGFTSLDADTATGFFTSANGLHGLFNNGYTLAIAWIDFAMPFSNNFDLDYTDYIGSHFRANVSGWTSAEFTTYSTTVASVPEPEPLIIWLLGSGLALIGFARRKKV